MLGLKLATDPRWANLAEKSLEDILTDHAYCEQKAALNGISMIVQYWDKEKLIEELSPLVTEEWGHFRQVMREMKKRGLTLGPKRKDLYVNELIKIEHTGGSRENRLMERLLISAMIEARSCERFRVLSLNMEEQEMRDFYHSFMVSEAGHYRMFLDLAKEYAPEEKVKARWQEILEAEEKIMLGLELRGDRVH